MGSLLKVFIHGYVWPHECVPRSSLVPESRPEGTSLSMQASQSARMLVFTVTVAPICWLDPPQPNIDMLYCCMLNI